MREKQLSGWQGREDARRDGALAVRRTRDGNDECWLELCGELDIASTPRLRRAIEASEALRPSRIVIDLSRVQFIDSSGLHALLEAREHAAQHRYELALLRGPSQVQRLFELTGCDSLFSFLD
jgi:anti-anti-sigma factor